ncbi:MAG: helix-turn-helix domain-containing protein, partial [Butyrivibrio sp.]|nr:helix-turn-helix domain-containing protein [Butyrivibrio sp.]
MKNRVTSRLIGLYHTCLLFMMNSKEVSMNKLSIGNYVLNARIKHGLTQSQLAKIIGVSDKTIS